MLRIGAAMLILGGVTKLGVKTYRQIRNKEFFTNVAPQTFYKGGFYATMNRREAQLILGVREGVSAEEIKQRHRKLMIMNHPDSGGSTYVAMKVNEAKDLLLKT